MKKYLIFSLLSLVFAFASAEKTYDIHPLKKIEANPINVAVMLMQENDTAKMASTLHYYGYQESQTPDSSKKFTHPNGSTIRYNLSDQKSPTVEVTSKGTNKEKDQILQNLNFHKNGNAYEQKSVGFTTRCTFGSHGTLFLARIPKPRK